MSGWKVPFINYPRAHEAHREEYEDAILSCIRKGDLVYRDALVNFEKEFAAFCDCKYGIGTGSCTGAMFIALKALNLPFMSEVITVSHTYIATIDAIVAAGSFPVLVDVEWDSMNMDPDKLEEAITPLTKAIIPVHLNGRMCDMGRIMDIAQKHGLYVIEDAAQAAGSTYDYHSSGSLGHMGCFSFYPAKVLGWYGEGGMAVTNDDKLASQLYLLRDHGEWPGYLPGGIKGEIYRFGYNTILDNIAAAVLSVKLKYLPAMIQRRREIAKLYFEGLPACITLPEVCSQNYVIRTQDRDALQAHLIDKRVETMVSWRTPNHKQKGLPDLHKFNLPVTERISRECLSLPMYPELTDSEVEYVVEAVRSFYK